MPDKILFKQTFLIITAKMKTLKLGKEESGVNRKLISRFGEAVYHDPEVQAIFIKVHFKDGTSISFTRNEDEDEIERLMEEDESQQQIFIPNFI